MPGKACYHCGLVVADMSAHDCWTTTEDRLTEDLPEDLRDAWLRLRETATAFGEQRVYASHRSIMFSRKTCYCYVRPKQSRLEVCFFLGRTVKSPVVRRSEAVSRVKVAHLVHVVHRDEVEPPLTEWLKEAYDVSDSLRVTAKAQRPTKGPKRRKKTSAAEGRPRRRSRDRSPKRD